MTIRNLAQLAPWTRTVPVADPERERLVAAQSGLVVHDGQTLNCETPPEMLGGRVTPTAQFYRRCHFPVPVVDPAAWRLEVGGLVDRPLSLSLHELTQLPAETMVVTLECAGNDRARMQPPAAGVQWGPGAVSTAEWTGPRLQEILQRAGIQAGAQEVIFRGADRGPVEQTEGEVRFERSLPVAAALGSEALLAYAMNGRPLPARHGYPLRLVVPGWYGMASVKWLTEIRVTGEPFRGFFQDQHYVYERGGAREPVQLQRVRALITRPGPGQELARGALTVRGVAWSGAAPIERVEVSVAGGPWQKARLTGTQETYGWQQWEFLACGLGPGEVTIRARASDLVGRDQPEHPEWNRLGYGANFIHQVGVTIR
jgi:DMSO/TMAO reductase YedYZ molybdopterin-dependent catalytic subunit